MYTKLVSFVGLCMSFSMLVACASTTLIKSKPEGARVYINGSYVGDTPYAYTDKAIAGSSQLVEIRKEGFRSNTALIKRNEEVNVGALVGGLFVWPVLLWMMDYRSQYVLELEPLSQKMADVK